MKNSTKQTYDYHHWANTRVFERLQELPDAIYSQEIKSVFPSIEAVIQHIYQVDGMWLSVMSGESFKETMGVIKQLKKDLTDASLERMREHYTNMASRYEAFLSTVADLDEPITINHPNYGELQATVTELVQHVVNHGTYHRGNIAAMLRQQGHKGVPTDYIFYLYANK